MSQINFSQAERAAIVRQLQGYFEQELEVELGQFDGEFLLDFIADKLGGYFYNRGLYDAQTFMAGKLADISDGLDELEKPTPL